jgi:hypothetical protein
MDLLIVVSPRDIAWLRYTLPMSLKSLKPVRCYLMSYTPEYFQEMFPECTSVSLSRLPFTYEDILRMSSRSAMRLVKQLAHLYAHHVLPLTRPLICMDAHAAVLAPLPDHGYGTRTLPNLHIVKHVTTLLPGSSTIYADDLPFYTIDAQCARELHMSVSASHRDEPFWRIYVASAVSGTTSDKSLYETWTKQALAPRKTHIVHKQLNTYSEVTTCDTQVVTCRVEYVPALLAQTQWTRLRRWIGDAHVTSLPIHAQTIADLPVGTVVHYGCGEAPSLDLWNGWNYIGVDSEDALERARALHPTHLFKSLDPCIDPIPLGTLALCTNFFSRLCYAHAMTVVLRMLQVYPVIMVVDYIPNGVPRINTDHPTGQWGVVWWDLAPYSVWSAVLHGYISMPNGKLACYRILKPSSTHKNGKRDGC